MARDSVLERRAPSPPPTKREGNPVSKIFVKAFAASSIMAVLSLSGPDGFVQAAHAQSPWWKCPSGQYALETMPEQGKARCVKAATQTRVLPDPGCPVGTTLDPDHSGRVDYCVPITGTVGPKPYPAKCGPGQQEERITGRDRCQTTTPADYKPVSLPG